MSVNILQTPRFDEPFESIFPYEFGEYPLTSLDNASITRLHYHSVHELGFCCSGHGECLFLDGSVPFETGDATFFLPYQAHFSNCTPDVTSKWYWFYFDLESAFSIQGFSPEFWHSLGETSVGNCGVLSHKKYPTLCRLIYEIIQSVNNASLENRNVTVSLLLAQFLVEASRVYDKEPSLVQLNKSSTVIRILPAIEYIRQHYQDSLSVDELSNLCHMSSSSFRRYFHAALNISPYDYIMKVRMKIAAHYLSNSEMPIVTVAQNCGIPDPANFIHHFSKKYQMTPKEYRKAHLRLTKSID